MWKTITPRRSNRNSLGLPARDVLVLSAIVAIAACNVALPYGGDQSLFALGARHILAGDVLYQDFWDLKQPAIFWFFAVARLAFGPGPFAVHVLEALWFFALSGVLYIAAKRLFATRDTSYIAPLLAAAYAQLTLTSDSATQVESLVSLPLVIALWLFAEAVRGTPRPGRLLFGAGLAASIAVCFKLLFIVVIATMFSAIFVAGARSGGLVRIRTCPIRATTGFVLGFAVPLTASVLWFFAHGALGYSLATWLVAPGDIVRELPHQDVAVLLAAARSYVITFLPLIVLAIFALTAIRRGHVLAWGALGWLLGGLATILIQVTSWWPYQWFLLATPTGLLATFGVLQLSQNGPVRYRYAAALGVILLVAYPAVRAHVKLIGLAQYGFAVNEGQREAFQETLTPSLGRARVAARELEVTGTRGGVYVLGNPILYETLGTLQPIAINGWLPELLTRSTRREFMHEMCRARVRTIYIDDAAKRDVARLLERAPDFATFLSTDYDRRKARFGDVYIRHDGGPDTCSPTRRFAKLTFKRS